MSEFYYFYYDKLQCEHVVGDSTDVVFYENKADMVKEFTRLASTGLFRIVYSSDTVSALKKFTGSMRVEK